MRGSPSERARWLAQNVVPHERTIRTWLARRAHRLDIDDVIQEMYMRLAGLESTDEIRSPQQYAAQTAISIMINMARHIRVVPMVSVADFEELGLTSQDPSPEQTLVSRGDLIELETALDALPERCRTAFLLRRVEGLSQKEVADRLGISRRTVEKYMAQSVRLLLRLYGRGGKHDAQVSKETGNDRTDFDQVISRK